MLGHSRMISLPQVNDCLNRGWIVLAPNHRLCPGVNLLDGPMRDIRDLLSWIYEGHLDEYLSSQGNWRADLGNVAAFGTSSGGHLALSLVLPTFEDSKSNCEADKSRVSVSPSQLKRFSRSMAQ